MIVGPEDVTHAIDVMNWLAAMTTHNDDPRGTIADAICVIVNELEYWEELLEEDT